MNNPEAETQGIWVIFATDFTDSHRKICDNLRNLWQRNKNNRLRSQTPRQSLKEFKD